MINKKLVLEKFSGVVSIVNAILFCIFLFTKTVFFYVEELSDFYIIQFTISALLNILLLVFGMLVIVEKKDNSYCKEMAVIFSISLLISTSNFNIVLTVLNSLVSLTSLISMFLKYSFINSNKNDVDPIILDLIETKEKRKHVNKSLENNVKEYEDISNLESEILLLKEKRNKKIISDEEYINELNYLYRKHL